MRETLLNEYFCTIICHEFYAFSLINGLKKKVDIFVEKPFLSANLSSFEGVHHHLHHHHQHPHHQQTEVMLKICIRHTFNHPLK